MEKLNPDGSSNLPVDIHVIKISSPLTACDIYSSDLINSESGSELTSVDL